MWQRILDKSWSTLFNLGDFLKTQIIHLATTVPDYSTWLFTLSIYEIIYAALFKDYQKIYKEKGEVYIFSEIRSRHFSV